LAARGIRVDGIDLSAPMVAKLRAKPGGADISITMGDFADVPRPRLLSLDLCGLQHPVQPADEEDQVRYFENVAAHLTDDGAFVIKGFVPGFLYRLHNNQQVKVEAIEVSEIRLDGGRHDPVTQRLDESHVVLSSKGVRLMPVVCRYTWPSELDLMARIAGLRLRERWAGWDREPFNSTSSNCISVYGR
jgi:SAM-dependent methyltransferase